MDQKESLIAGLLVLMALILGIILGIGEEKRNIARDGYFTYNKTTYKIVPLPKIMEKNNER